MNSENRHHITSLRKCGNEAWPFQLNTIDLLGDFTREVGRHLNIFIAIFLNLNLVIYKHTSVPNFTLIYVGTTTTDRWRVESHFFRVWGQSLGLCSAANVTGICLCKCDNVFDICNEATYNPRPTWSQAVIKTLSESQISWSFNNSSNSLFLLFQTMFDAFSQFILQYRHVPIQS